jgi:hypothetical protein
MDTLHYLHMAGQPVPEKNVRNALTTLQHRFMRWGFPVMPLTGIEKLLHEYWVYQRIKAGRVKNWPYRDPDEARKLYEQDQYVRVQDRLTALREPAASKPE